MEAVHVYENHVPSHEWLRDESADTLIVHVPGFKKDQLKILIGAGDGKLIVTGERPLPTDLTRSRRFREEFRLPENCMAEQIQGKLEGGILLVVLPHAVNKGMGEKSTDWKTKLKTVGMGIGLHEPVGRAFMMGLVMAVTVAAWCLHCCLPSYLKTKLKKTN